MSVPDRIGTLVLERLGMGLVPPIDVEQLAEQLGVRCIEPREMFEEGRLERRGDDVRIYIRPDLSPRRARFTIAHEVAHLLLVRSEAPLVAYRDRLQTDDEERLCDRIAASIVLPAPWVEQRFAHRSQNLSTVRHLAHTAQVSMAAATVRLTELCGWTSSLLRWRKTGDRWLFLAGAAVPPDLHGAIRSAPSTTIVLDQVGARTRRDFNAELPLLIDDRPIAVQAQLSVSRRAALALATMLPSPATTPHHR